MPGCKIVNRPLWCCVRFLPFVSWLYCALWVFEQCRSEYPVRCVSRCVRLYITLHAKILSQKHGNVYTHSNMKASPLQTMSYRSIWTFRFTHSYLYWFFFSGRALLKKWRSMCVQVVEIREPFRGFLFETSGLLREICLKLVAAFFHKEFRPKQGISGKTNIQKYPLGYLDTSGRAMK